MSLESSAAQLAVTAIDTLLRSKSLKETQRKTLIEAKKIAAGKIIDAVADRKIGKK